VAEKIPPGLIVNADDLGIHPRINAGILSAYRSGILTSATMLMTTPYLDETVRDAVRGGPLPIGIHLSLTLGKSVAGRGAVPDLVDDNNDFVWPARRLLLCRFRGQDERLLGQIRRELEAQLALARDHGLRPTHADSHQHVHMNPAIFSLVEELLRHFGIKRVRFSREAMSLSAAAALLRHGKYINVAKIALLRWLGSHIRPQLPTTDAFLGVLDSGVLDKQTIATAIRALPPHRSLEICIHPGFPAPSDGTAYPHAYVNDFIGAAARQLEHDILVDPELYALAVRHGVVLRDFAGREKMA
jgi:chitin disaccharide deacetylase